MVLIFYFIATLKSIICLCISTVFVMEVWIEVFPGVESVAQQCTKLLPLQKFPWRQKGLFKLL